MNPKTATEWRATINHNNCKITLTGNQQDVQALVSQILGAARFAEVGGGTTFIHLGQDTVGVINEYQTFERYTVANQQKNLRVA